MAVTILLDDDKADIRSKFATGEYTKASLGREYDVSPRTIGRVISEVIITAAPDEKHEYQIVGSSSSLTVVRDDGKTYCIDSSNRRFDECMNFIKGKGLSNEVLEELTDLIDLKTYVGSVTEGAITINPDDGTAIYAFDTNTAVDLPDTLANTLCEAVASSDRCGIRKLTKFATLLLDNNDDDIIAELFDFLLASDIQIDPDGRVICWKRVRDNYKDLYSGKFDNSPGKVCEVPRNAVDPDRQRTCSHGLHVCSKAYLPHYYSGQGRVIKVAVNPADFISIPDEYYGVADDGEVTAKARVCRYEVLEDVTDQFKSL